MLYNNDGLGRRRNAWESFPNGEPTWYRWEGPTRPCEDSFLAMTGSAELAGVEKREA